MKVESLGKMSMSDVVFQQMAGMTILVTHLVVEFSKRMPGFLQLERDDQIALLKVSILTTVQPSLKATTAKCYVGDQ